MIPRPWFRLYREVLHDRKIAHICYATEQSKATVLGFWVALLCIASESPQPGTLILSDDVALTVEAIAWETELDLNVAETIINLMIKFDMLTRAPDGTLIITHWAERQFESDTSTPRVRRHRQRKKTASEDEMFDETFDVTDDETPRVTR